MSDSSEGCITGKNCAKLLFTCGTFSNSNVLCNSSKILLEIGDNSERHAPRIHPLGSSMLRRVPHVPTITTHTQ